MFITDPEYDFWPWYWTHNGKELTNMEEHIDAFKILDPYTDRTYNPTSYLFTNNDAHTMKRHVTDNIVCNTIEPDISEKISLKRFFLR